MGTFYDYKRDLATNRVNALKRGMLAGCYAGNVLVFFAISEKFCLRNHYLIIQTALLVARNVWNFTPWL